MESRGYRHSALPAPTAPHAWPYKHSPNLQSSIPPYPNIMVRLSLVGFALAAASVLVPGVLSQTPPACATTCATEVGTTLGCDPTTTACLCTQTFATDAGQCLAAECSAADLATAEAYFETLCGSTTSSVLSTDTGTSSGTATTPTTSTSGTLPTTSTSPTGTTSKPTTTGTSSTTSTSSTATPSSSSKPNHAMRDQPAGVLGAGLALAVALFA
ncbi:hypothetical protein EI94DRAFT_1729033 [Lactarius quietus]|nr:hypothetical protein EI94DRAFT_1729033 [Lactarius quietus]